jgi:hypothetical protein
MLLPIKLATGKQPAKKQKVQKDLGLVITPEMQKNIEATNPQGIVERAKRIEAVRAEQEQFWKGIKQGEAQLAYEQTLKQAAQQPKQAKAFVPKLQELEKQISPPPVSREVVMQKRVPKTPEGLATISILTDYGTASYTATPEETQILEFGTIDEGAALRNRLRQEAQAYAQEQGLKKKRQTAQAYVTDKVNAALNPNFVDEQVAETLRAELDDTIFDFAAKYSAGGKLLKTGRDALKSASTKLKNVDDVGAQVTAGLIDSIINPVSSFATATANVYDPTATQEERVGAAGNIALYALGALPVTEAVGASVRAFKTGADVAEGLSLAARSLLKSTAPGRFIDRKVTINDLVNVLERNGQMAGKTRGQLAKEFASGGKEFARATGQAPELFYNKYLNDLADQAQPATPAQFDVTAPKAPESPTQVEDLGTVVDELVGKTELVVAEPTLYTPEKYGLLTETDINSKFPKAQKYVGEYEIGENVPNIDSIDSSIGDNEYDNIEYGIRILSTDDFADSIKGINYANAKDVERVNNLAEQIALNKRIDPLIVIRDKEGFYILEGNHRYEAIKKLGIKKFPALLVDDVDSLVEGVETAVKNGEKLSDELLSEYQSSEIVKNSIKPTAPPASIVDEIEQGMGASKSTAPPPPTEPTVTGIPETPEPITSGISNKANLSSEELGLISEAPQGKGRSASQVVEETINRNPSDKELEILAGKVANGQALNADDTAVLLVGQGRFNLRVFNAREALDNAIKSGASAQDIDQLRDAWLLAQADATNFAKQIQRGKSGWSDVGRVLQQKTDLFTGELSQIKANIIAEAELRKGRTLTDAEQENYKTMIDKLIGENKKLEEELAKLKATRSQATGEGRVRRTRTLDNLDKSIAQKENKIRVNKATVTQKLNNEIPVATSTRLGQFITEMKLLNPFSRLTDFASNTIKLIDNIVSTPINMAVDQKTSRLLKTQPVYSSSYLAKDRWKNLLINSWEKMKADLKIVAAGGDVETIEKYGGAQGLGSKAAGFTDVPFKAIYHEDGKFLAADVKAREMLTEELGKGNFGKRDVDAKRTEILENIDQYPDIIMNAEEYALNETFNNHNWVSEINKKLKSGMSPTGRLLYDEAIGRFSKVITNVATDIADRTGLGVARGIYNIADAMKSGKNLTTAERMAINKMITKGMIGVPLMYLGYKNWDKIEGEIRGVQQKYIDYGDLGKLGGPIAIFLHGASIGRAMNELSPDKVNDFVIASSLRLPFNTPFVSNVADISDVLDNPTPQAVAKYAAKKTANTFIPAIVREIATRMDTEKGIQTGMELEREKAPKGASTAEIFKGEFMSKIPGLRQQLPLKGSGRQPVTPGVTP